MPRVFRTMYREGDKPLVGNDAKSLGVRLDGPKQDIPVSLTNMVEPKSGGMSVSSEWIYLPPHRIPKRLRPKCKLADGSDKYVVWVFGDGVFEVGNFAEGLWLSIDTDDPTHGYVEPDVIMPLVNYCNWLVATRDDWKAIEE